MKLSKISTVALIVILSVNCFGASIKITSTGGTLPKSLGIGSYSPMIEIEYSGLEAGKKYTLKGWLLNRGPWYCASGQWCESSYTIDNTDGTNSSGKLQIVKNMDVYAYNSLDWVFRLYYNGSQVAWKERYLSTSSNRPPVLSKIDNFNTHVGGGVAFEAVASDPEGLEITYSISNMPEGALFEDGVFTWIPETEGDYRLIVHASDGVTYDSQEVFVNVGDYPELELADVHIPLCGTTENVTGKVIGGESYEDFRVFSLVFVGGAGWFTKPYADSPKTVIATDGSFEIDITTGGIDELAAIVYLGICHKDVEIPILANGSGIPAINEICSQKFYRDPTECHRVINWSGQDWWVKDSRDGTLGPGQNYFSPSTDNVFVDVEGNLHLKMVYAGGKWTCPEIVSINSFGYGVYNFVLKENPSLAINVTFGAFTWENDVPQFNSREIDLELGYWNVANGPFGQFVIQPWNKTENIFKYDVPEINGPYLYSFEWQENSITGYALASATSSPILEDIFTEWTYEGSDNPEFGLEKVRFNLWLTEGSSPVDGLEQEVIVKSFNHYTSNDCLELEILASENGSVVASSMQGLDSFYPVESVVNLTAIPEPGYSVSEWVGADRDCTCLNNTITIGALNIVGAVFTKDIVYRSLTLTQGEHGLIFASEGVDDPAPEGTVVTVTALPNPGYSLTSWTGTDDDTITTLENTVTLGVVNVVSALFTKDIVYRTLTLTQTEHGLIVATEGVEDPAPEGTVVSLTAIPDSGYSLRSWTGTDNDSAGVSNTVTLGEVNVVSALFVQKTAMSLTTVTIRASSDRQSPKDSIILKGILPDFDGSKITGPISISVGDIGFVLNATVKDSKVLGRSGYNLLVINLKKNSFVFSARRADLTGFKSPLSVVFSTGSYEAIATADESLINKKKPIPFNFLMGVEDSMNVSKVSVKKSGVTLTGEISFAKLYSSFPSIYASIGGAVDVIELTGKNGNFKYSPKNPIGLVKSFAVNLRSCKFKLVLDPVIVWNAIHTEIFTIGLSSDDFSLTVHAQLTGLEDIMDSLRGQIKFTSVPPRGSFNDLRGSVKGVNSNQYGVAVYIRVGSTWWQKPEWASPVTYINGGKWVCDITTGGIDSTANAVLAFLIPKTFDPPSSPTSQMYADFPYVHQDR